jgi:hypothetical protein
VFLGIGSVRLYFLSYFSISRLPKHNEEAEVSTLSVIAITLRYVFALSYNALTLWRNIIASVSYRFEHLEAVIASYSYCSELVDKCYCSY